MTWYILEAVLYLVAGRLLNKISVEVASDDRKREDPSLPVMDRLIRLLLFPLRYYEWEKRLDCSKMGPSFFIVSRMRNQGYTDGISVWLASVFWPLKGFTLVIALIILGGYSIECLTDVIVNMIGHCKSRLSSLFEGKSKFGRLSQLENPQLKQQLERLEELRVEVFNKLGNRKRFLERWRTLQGQAMGLTNYPNLDRDHYQPKITELEQVVQKLEDGLTEIAQRISEATASSRELEVLTKTLKLYEETSEVAGTDHYQEELKERIAMIMERVNTSMGVCRKFCELEAYSEKKLRQEEAQAAKLLRFKN